MVTIFADVVYSTKSGLEAYVHSTNNGGPFPAVGSVTLGNGSKRTAMWAMDGTSHKNQPEEWSIAIKSTEDSTRLRNGDPCMCILRSSPDTYRPAYFAGRRNGSMYVYSHGTAPWTARGEEVALRVRGLSSDEIAHMHRILLGVSLGADENGWVTNAGLNYFGQDTDRVEVVTRASLSAAGSAANAVTRTCLAGKVDWALTGGATDVVLFRPVVED